MHTIAAHPIIIIANNFISFIMYFTSLKLIFVQFTVQIPMNSHILLGINAIRLFWQLPDPFDVVSHR